MSRGTQHASGLLLARKSFLIMLLIVTIEGAARKWISPALTLPLIIARDAAAFVTIWLLFRRKLIRPDNVIVAALVAWSVLVIIWGGTQIIAGESSFAVYFIGLRFWLLYLWLGVALGLSLRASDVNAITKFGALILCLCVPLVLVQHFSPPTSFINKQVDDGDVFLVAAGVVRVTGTFSFTLGFTTFIAFLSPLIISANIELRSSGLRRWQCVAALISILVCTGISGSRSALILFAALLPIVLVSGLVVLRGAERRRVFHLAVLSAVISGGLFFALPSAVDATTDRFETAADSEPLGGRVLTIFVGEPDVYERVEWLGRGIGMGSNLAAYFLSGERYFALAEAENGRVLIEGGALGGALIVIKAVVILLGLGLAMVQSLRFRQVLPVAVWCVLSVAILTWSWIGQLTAQPFMGLLLAIGIAVIRRDVLRERLAA